MHLDHRRTIDRKGVTAKKAVTPLIYWCRDQDLNQGHTDFQSVALPTELSRHLNFKFYTSIKNREWLSIVFYFLFCSNSSSRSISNLSKAVPVFTEAAYRLPATLPATNLVGEFRFNPLM